MNLSGAPNNEASGYRIPRSQRAAPHVDPPVALENIEKITLRTNFFSSLLDQKARAVGRLTAQP
jgi:hypothetical protein